MKNLIIKNKKKKPKISKYELRDTIELALLQLPGLLHMLIFCYIPMFGVIIAFKKFNPHLGVFGSKWVGFDNFMFFFKSNDFFRIMRNTLGYSSLHLILDTIAALSVAILFYGISKRWVLKIYQTTMILPNFMSAVLIAFVVYAILNPVSGVLNKVLVLMGGESKDWYSESIYWPFILTIVQLWKSVGMKSILYYAALMGIDESLFEAARIDGAKKWHEIRYIMIPEIMGLITIQLIMGIGQLVNGDFGLFYQTPMNVGVLYSTTDIINTYVFRALQEASNMGRTAAVGLFQSVTGAILLIISNTIVRKVDPDKSFF